jgi:predicted AlkP superfamily pyrophosphatase or phosphodiesterase
VRRLAFGLLPFTLAASLAGGCERDSGGESGQASGEASEASAEPVVEPVVEPVIEPVEPVEPTLPKLVVVIVVDQMRFDYFDHFDAQWQHGLRQLREQGRFFTQARHQHAMTETAPGHATISTGTHPAHHGIVANSWLDRTTRTKVNAIDDPSAKVFGNPDAIGISSASLLRESVGDWMQAANQDAVVVSVAIKDRAAILMGGKHPDAAIWYDSKLGDFTTSSYYGEQLPAWVGAYNEKGRAAALYGETGWTLSQPDDAYGSSRREIDPKLVTTFEDYALTKQFPHVIAADGKQPRNVMRDTPFGDQMLLELARDAIAATHMGADDVPDLLLVGISGADYAGHRYGPDSIEIHDYFLRLDEQLGTFVADLDRQFGSDYVLLLTSDHGVAPMPEYSDIPTAGRFGGKLALATALAAAAKALDLPKSQQPTLEFTHGVDLTFPESVDEATRAKFRSELARLLREREEIEDAWTRDELAGSENRNEYAQPWRISFFPERSSDINLQFAPGVVLYSEGTGHGTPYPYDQHVPLLIRGAGSPGVDDQPVASVDVAPTIAGLVGVAVPAGVDGKAISLE